MKSGSFIDQCLTNPTSLDDIDDFIDTWHEGGTGLEIWEFLGMSRDDYAAWLVDIDVLPAVIEAHRRGVPLCEATADLATTPGS